MKSSGIGDTAYFGPEAEFFVFDNVRYGVGEQLRAIYKLDSEEGPYNTEGASRKATWATARP